MTTATETGFAVLSVEEVLLSREGDERQRVRLRRELGIDAFGISAVRASSAGTTAINDHDEIGPGSDRHQELYLVLEGHAVFTVAGEEVDAPRGSAVVVRHPEIRRSAVAKEDGTIIVAVGAPAGSAYRITPGEAMADVMTPYNAKDYAGALAIAKGLLHQYPGNGLALYNIACMEALLGQREEALEHLAQAVEAAPSLLENARSDDDFASLRGDERFEGLIAN